MEKWKRIKGFEDSYEVSDLGNVRSIDRFVNHGDKMVMHRGKNLFQNTDKDGYRLVALRKNKTTSVKRVHRLVFEAFIGGIDGSAVIDHINNVKNDNRAVNLQQVTTRVNTTKDRTNKDDLPHGVRLNRDKFVATIYIKHKAYYIGTFNTPDEAGLAYQEALSNYNDKGILPFLSRIRDMHKDGFKVCTNCMERKPIEDFYFSKKYNFHQSKCKECCKDYAKQQRLNKNNTKHND